MLILPDWGRVFFREVWRCEMKFRYWLANIISGGALSEAAADKTYWQREANQGWLTATIRMLSLQEIAAMETPKANATVRRMAAVAREALE